MNICYSYNKEGGKVERYENHIKSAVAAWSVIKPYYEKVLDRVLGKLEFDPIAVALAIHDLGKLTNAYEMSPRNFRHEIFSGYAMYKILGKRPEDVKMILSLAVTLHHENILMGVYVGELGERYLTISNIRRILDTFKDKLKPNCDVKRTFNELLKNFLVRKGLINDEFVNDIMEFIDHWLNDGIKIDDIIYSIKDMIAWASVGPLEDLLIRRARVASVLHLITLADSIAANVLRSGDMKDEGNWIVERVSKGAEPVDINEIKDAINKVMGNAP
ncbi:hypothetical protein [Vulcanisaeta souniana]|uniref:hypothetical protein n=1 Tax=Vulcanisaeta souniana TaxID=164452 RepID=UPI0006D21A6E|nr:hypothetical protein [Vulcanisaeta souniana]